jgi:transcriptional regulator GlxA family with amidase domain
MSRYHFSRRFKEALGESPYQYLLHLRLNRAADLLRSGELSVTEAALDVGFTELGRFSQMFRAFLGKTPTEFRRAARSTDRPSKLKLVS